MQRCTFHPYPNNINKESYEKNPFYILSFVILLCCYGTNIPKLFFGISMVPPPQLHLPDRKSGLSLAIGKYGKWDGLKANDTEKQFVSPVLPIGEKRLTPQISPYEALRHNAIYTLEILQISQKPLEGSESPARFTFS